jgi:hypothetical protein
MFFKKPSHCVVRGMSAWHFSSRGWLFYYFFCEKHLEFIHTFCNNFCFISWARIFNKLFPSPYIIRHVLPHKRRITSLVLQRTCWIPRTICIKVFSRILSISSLDTCVLDSITEALCYTVYRPLLRSINLRSFYAGTQWCHSVVYIYMSHKIWMPALLSTETLKPTL